MAKLTTFDARELVQQRRASGVLDRRANGDLVESIAADRDEPGLEVDDG